MSHKASRISLGLLQSASNGGDPEADIILELIDRVTFLEQSVLELGQIALKLTTLPSGEVKINPPSVGISPPQPQRDLPGPQEIAECGGPCETQGPEACDCQPPLPTDQTAEHRERGGLPYYPPNTTFKERLAICIQHELTYGGSAVACATALSRDMELGWIVPPMRFTFGRRPR